MKHKELSTSNPRPNTGEDNDRKAKATRTEGQWRDIERQRELIEENRALENDPTHLRREDAGREQDEKAQQVAQASADSQRGVISDLENIFHNGTEVQLQLLRLAIEQSN